MLSLSQVISLARARKVGWRQELIQCRYFEFQGEKPNFFCDACGQHEGQHNTNLPITSVLYIINTIDLLLQLQYICVLKNYYLQLNY